MMGQALPSLLFTRAEAIEERRSLSSTDEVDAIIVVMCGRVEERRSLSRKSNFSSEKICGQH